MPIKITRPTMPLLDVNKLPVAGITNSMSVEEAMEKASFLPDGTYYLQFEARLDVTGNTPLDPTPDPEPTPEPEPTLDPEPEPDPDQEPVPLPEIPIGDVSALQELGLLPEYVSVGNRSVDTAIDWDHTSGERSEIGLFPEDHAAFIAGQTDLKDGILQTALQAPPSNMSHEHKPNLYWLPYLLTGDVRYVRNMELTWSYFAAWRKNELTQGLDWRDHGRAMAWTLRDLAQLAYLQKLGVTEHDYYITALEASLKRFQNLASNNPVSQTWNILGFKPEHVAGWCGWMESFVGQALAHTVRLGFTEFKPIAEFQFQNLVKRSGTEWPFKSVDNDHVNYANFGQTKETATWDNVDPYHGLNAEYQALPDDQLIPLGPIGGRVYTYRQRAQYAYGHAALAASIGIEGASEKRDQIYTSIKARGDSWDTKNHYSGGVITTPPVVVEPTPEEPPVVIDPPSGGVWTGWDSLPLNEWVNVGVDPSAQILKRLTDAGIPTDKFKVAGSIKAWVAGERVGAKFYIPWGGGHGDSYLNGIWGLDIERMQMFIEQLPTHPSLLSDEYKNSRNYTSYPDSEWPKDILPDGKPTSRHTYALWHDTKRNTINSSRSSWWAYNLDTKETTRTLWKNGAGEIKTPTINNHLMYDEPTDTVAGLFRLTDTDYYAGAIIDPDGNGLFQRTGLPKSNNPAIACKNYADRELWIFVWRDNKEWLQKFGFETRQWTVKETDFAISYDYTVEMSPCVMLPDGKALRQFSGPSALRGKWFIYDDATGTNTPATFNINPFELRVGSKMFYYPDRKAVIYLTSDSVHVMRAE